MFNWLGVVLAGLLNGSFAVPLKTTRVWKFNQIWTLHSLLAMGVIPWLVVVAAVPNWHELLARVELRGWLTLVGWGVLFGVGSLLYGIAVDLLGIALGFAIQLGLSIVLGALLPLLWARAFELHSRGDWLFLLGLAMMVVGVVLCAQAGGSKSAAGSSGARQFRLGLLIAIAGGVLAPTLNFGIEYGSALLSRGAEARTASAFPVQIYLAWAVFLSAAAAVQAGYCFAQAVRERSTHLFAAGLATRDALQVPVMSLLWISATYLYGRAAFALGPLGHSFGWPVFLAFIILTSNGWGILLGEWKQASQAAFYRMLAGSSVLIAAAFLIGQSKRG